MTDPSALQVHFLAALPRIEAVATYKFRNIAPEAREEKVAETIAIAWKTYARLAQRGKNPDEFITKVAERSAQAVKAGRRLAGSEPMKDVTTKAAQEKQGFRVDPLPTVDSSPHEHDTLDALRDNTQTPVPDQVAFRIDWPEFLKRMGTRDASVVEDLAAGEGTGELADKYHLSPGRISQIRTKAQDKWTEMAQAPEVERCR